MVPYRLIALPTADLPLLSSCAIKLAFSHGLLKELSMLVVRAEEVIRHREGWEEAEMASKVAAFARRMLCHTQRYRREWMHCLGWRIWQAESQQRGSALRRAHYINA